MNTQFAAPATRLRRFFLACALGFVLYACGAPTSAPATRQPITIEVIPTETPNGRIAVIENAGAVYTINPDGTDRAFVNISGLVNNAAVAWSPDSTRLALGAVADTRDGSQLIVSDARGRDPLSIYDAELFGVPFYLSWSPSGNHIAFLANRPTGGLSLRVIDAGGERQPTLIANGEPSYFSWAPDGQRLLLHIGAEDGLIGTYALGETEIDRRDTTPGVFQAPAWSPTGEAYVFARTTSDQGGEVILVQDGRENIVANYNGFVNFIWSPDGSRLAYSMLADDGRRFDRLTVIDAQSQDSQLLTSDGHLAYYWSPDSTRLAYLSFRLVPSGASGQPAEGRDVLVSNPAQDGGDLLELTWNVIDIASSQNTRLVSYMPTRQFGFTLAYFDQYAQSASLWSPDSRYLLLIGSPEGGESAIYRVDTLIGSDERIQVIGPGEYAVWSWK